MFHGRVSDPLWNLPGLSTEIAAPRMLNSHGDFELLSLGSPLKCHLFQEALLDHLPKAILFLPF
jgi:hypothetical protein